MLTLTGGTRWYRYSEFETGSDFGTTPGCLNVPNGQCTADQVNLDAENLHKTYSGFKSRGNVTWHITPDTMVYYTYSQGYRPGGFNRSQGFVATGADGVKQYNKPAGYAPDSLTNQEVGWKTEFFDHRIQINGPLTTWTGTTCRWSSSTPARSAIPPSAPTDPTTRSTGWSCS